ncbi:MAG: hypothetical protein LBT05_14145 [Planctomycetaceae bacterium]|nr:hypothetical protein [Planctomycetaceae bacterium]
MWKTNPGYWNLLPETLISPVRGLIVFSRGAFRRLHRRLRLISSLTRLSDAKPRLRPSAYTIRRTTFSAYRMTISLLKSGKVKGIR